MTLTGYYISDILQNNTIMPQLLKLNRENPLKMIVNRNQR